jgi:hypothetical protein
VVALVLSLLIHLFFFGTWKLGQRLHWWDQQSSWLVKLTERMLHSPARPKPLSPARQMEETPVPQIPVTFVEIDPASTTVEAPKDAPFYSTQNSKAANPEPTVDTAQPKIEGKQDKVVKLMENDRPNPVPLQPSPPKPAEPEVAPKPKGGELPGDLALAKPRDPTPPSDGQVDVGVGESRTPPRKRPKTVAEAKAQKAMLAGEKIQQEGGVQQQGRASVNAIVTGFSDYDRAFIVAVQTRWYAFLDENRSSMRTGKVVLEFRLHSDGRITNMNMVGNDVGEILGLYCQSAVLEPAPFQPWPDSMRRAIGASYRDVKFTFFYN